MTINAKIKEYTTRLQEQGLLRHRQILESNASDLIRFDSNDYLSLTEDRRVLEAYQKGYQLSPCGSGASMVLSGYHANHKALEKAFAELLQVDDCILFSSGYAANLAITALLGRIQVHCFIDKSVHASIYDGLALSQVAYSRYVHNDMLALSNLLKSNSEDSILITEGVFSMSGQMAPLSTINSLCKKTCTEVIVDEAHAFGVIGPDGKGAVPFHGLTQNEVPLRVIPFGKALASQGALVAGRQNWINALLQAARSFIYSTAISPALCYGLLKTLDILINEEYRRIKLQQLITHFKNLIQSSPLNWLASDTPIQQLKLGCPHKALHYASELKKKEFHCSAIRSPTVNSSSSGLRVIINFKHTPEQISELFNALHLIYEHSFR
ncbi:8-amino-7-oxononanoate synthase [Legionella norrlandica]|uniref:8-amino-7-oxononanoate synthase n=1 Tax=Legionella norrlandica TaxID=1498499 RepID=A0A0A2STI9_9GAMM|nr:aminotransferase class I/II-fold pyridoxal phosphate-dependent enzyme [Legionella norrlandica]KGP64400.1 8-amino-7-oxononanoate synthase [Legionella norrlandica]